MLTLNSLVVFPAQRSGEETVQPQRREDTRVTEENNEIVEGKLLDTRSPTAEKAQRKRGAIDPAKTDSCRL